MTLPEGKSGEAARLNMTTLGKILRPWPAGLLPNVLCNNGPIGSVFSSHCHQQYLKYSADVPCNYVGAVLKLKISIDVAFIRARY
jgi:hypothetical protein